MQQLKMFKWLLPLVLTFFFTACGGGGGSSENITVDTIAPSTPTLTTTPTQSSQNSVAVEVNGEAGSDVYVNGTKTTTIGSTGKENITLSLAGDDGLKSFSITLKDSKENESSALTFAITKDATAPSFSIGDVTVAENQTSAFSVNATDAHSISYVLDGLDKASFNISTTGVVTFKEAPDYEEIRERSFIVSVTATDSFGNAKSEALTVYVSNIAEHVPTLQPGLAGSIAENSVAGTLVGGGSIVGVNVTYSGDTAISNIALSGTYASLFELDENNKFKLKASNTLDHETTGQFIYIDAVATNDAGDSEKVTYNIEVENVADVVPTLTAFSGSVDENATIGTTVGTVTLTSMGDSSISSYDLNDTTNFTINGVGKITTVSTLNYEVKAEYNLSVTATNEAGVSSAVALNIAVNDVAEAPKKTGQTKSYDSSGNEVLDASVKDDGHYQKGTTPSYTRDDVNEVVTDNLTGLMWQDDDAVASVTKQWLTDENYATCENNTSDPACLDTTGDTATTYCTDLVMGGYEDWRLPTSVELEGIVNYGISSPSIDTTFQNTSSSDYWSSTSIVGYEHDAWIVVFDDGLVNGIHKDFSNCVRCVRDGQ